MSKNLVTYGGPHDFTILFELDKTVDPLKFQNYANKRKLRNELPEELQKHIARIKIKINDKHEGKVQFMNTTKFPQDASRMMSKWSELMINVLVDEYKKQ